jgi:hypothetical protein
MQFGYAGFNRGPPGDGVEPEWRRRLHDKARDFTATVI